ncbi:MAG: hypothetical protein RPT94_14055, partial [Candidatus Sedimenticola sp. (ex Thyasira tokunagai)]
CKFGVLTKASPDPEHKKTHQDFSNLELNCRLGIDSCHPWHSPLRGRDITRSKRLPAVFIEFRALTKASLDPKHKKPPVGLFSTGGELPARD